MENVHLHLNYHQQFVEMESSIHGCVAEIIDARWRMFGQKHERGKCGRVECQRSRVVAVNFFDCRADSGSLVDIV